ncbi:uncharacterized protein Tco025E_08986 [Trypanosoma conorhini]|uniref:Uncharacterized protein n=1 Tax=Trypanosoma conorhini TaxID=83891 RepID=A0A3R7M508_9TRYP|nr:uncharacterized protein Tco025E_08986 [Trypanosoma conorhini]RNE99547.1 hypothetical protein Tco025E_08986 [Trypanosoma conorhini]
MRSNGGAAPSEAAYYISVTQDVLNKLDTLLLQIDRLETQHSAESRDALETKMIRVLQDRLPRLIQQLWQEICLVLTPFASSQGGECISREEIWDELAYQCAQLSFFKSIYRFATAVLSGEALEGASDTPTKCRCLERLLKERQHIWASAEGQLIREWLRGFVKKVLFAAASPAETEGVSLYQLGESVALRQDAPWKLKPEGLRETPQEIGAHPVFVVPDGDAIDVERMRQEFLRLLRAACLDVGEELLSLVRQKGLSQPTFPTETHLWVGTDTSGDEKKMETAAPCHDNAGVGPLAPAALIAGNDRWVFFRTRPNDDPALTVDEVAGQVRAFYEIYNAAKAPLASVLAEGYGDDYADLFDSLEFRYLIPKTSILSVAQELAPGVSDTPPTETSVHVHEETAVVADEESGVPASTCLLM